MERPVFSDSVSIKAILIGLVGYIVAATVAMIIVVQFWMPAGITDPAKLSRLAEADPTLVMWQNILGTVFCVLAGIVVVRISRSKGLKNPLVLGILLLFYGVLGIYLHPGHPTLMQIAKLVVPVPLALAGGWLGLRRVPRTEVDA